MTSLGKVLIISGIILIAAGLLISFAGNKFGWFGNLPGDINIKKDNFRFYAPITSMLLISAILSFILWVISKFR